jgi:hypothetical protein
MIEDAFNAYVKHTTEQWDRNDTVGSSEIGQCARKVCYAKHGQPREAGAPDGWGAHVRGSTFERHFWYEALKLKYKSKLLYAGPKQKTFSVGCLSSTPDGLVFGLRSDALRQYGVRDIESDCILVECKTIDPRTHISEAREQNKYQVQVQLGLIREKTKYKPVYAAISYTNASMWDDVSVYVEKFNPKVYAYAKERAKEILFKNAKELRPEGWIAGGDECKWCPYTRACGVARRDLPEEDKLKKVDPQFAAEVTDMCRAAKALEDKAKRAASAVLLAHQGIKDRLRDRGVRRIKDVVQWSAVKARLSYDYAKLRKAAADAGVDVDQYSTVGEPTDRLQIFVSATERGVDTDGQASKEAGKQAAEDDPSAQDSEPR